MSAEHVRNQYKNIKGKIRNCKYNKTKERKKETVDMNLLLYL